MSLSKLNLEAAGSISASYLIQFLNIGTGIVLANSISPSERGVLAAAVLLPPILLTLGSVGLPEAITFHLAAQATMDRGLLSAALTAAGVAGVSAAAVSLILSFAMYPDYPHDAFLIYAAYPPIAAITGVAVQALLGVGKIALYNLTRLAVQAITLMLLLLAEYLDGLTVNGVVTIYLIAEIATAILAWRLLGTLPSPSVRVSELRLLFGFGWKASLSLAATVVIERGDQLVLAQKLTASELGQYVVASSVGGAVLVIGASIGPLALRRITVVATFDRKRMVLQSAVATIVASTLAALGVSAASPRLIPALMGAKYVDSVAIAQTLCFAAIFIGTNRVLSGGLKAMGRSLFAGVTQICGAALTVSAIAWVAGSWGLQGAALALTGGSAVTMFALVGAILTSRSERLKEQRVVLPLQ